MSSWSQPCDRQTRSLLTTGWALRCSWRLTLSPEIKVNLVNLELLSYNHCSTSKYLYILRKCPILSLASDGGELRTRDLAMIDDGIVCVCVQTHSFPLYITLIKTFLLSQMSPDNSNRTLIHFFTNDVVFNWPRKD